MLSKLDGYLNDIYLGVLAWARQLGAPGYVLLTLLVLVVFTGLVLSQRRKAKKNLEMYVPPLKSKQDGIDSNN